MLMPARHARIASMRLAPPTTATALATSAHDACVLDGNSSANAEIIVSYLINA